MPPRSGTGEECRCRRRNQDYSLDQVQQIPAQVGNWRIVNDVFLGKNKEGVDDDPPHQQDENIQRARQHPLAFIGLMGADGHGRHDGDYMQKQHDVSLEWIG